MQLLPHEIAIGIVCGAFNDGDGNAPDPRDFFTHREAVDFLQDFTGESYGSDCAAWTRWFDHCPADLLHDFYDAYNELMHSPDGRFFSQMCDYANSRWDGVTERRCPKCESLCPEYRERCYACRHVLGRT